MCFDIADRTLEPDLYARAAKRRYAYKVLWRKKVNGRFGSGLRNPYPSRGVVIYYLGRSRVLRPDQLWLTEEMPGTTRISGQGLYVFTTLRAARRSKRIGYCKSTNCVIVKCQVDPADLLHVSERGDATATYRRIKPVEIIYDATARK